MTNPSLVSVVDDDESVREALPELLRSFGFDTRAFDSAEAFLASDALEGTGCLVLDVAMPGMTGPELQRELARRQIKVGIVFITAQSDDRVEVDAMRRGATAFLLKPFDETLIIDAVNAALGKE
ncbi:response regulator [Caulobacter sp. 602-1]|uniref:response regulator n=1 Tax=Caulobacter sp. 602-1 TaxID=2492472 RepID=UPI000F633F94|nr:response regulator [Caulobacter sp. 602-1]RRN63986.1 response regulator [Caulobacter sp. 602-1]